MKIQNDLHAIRLLFSFNLLAFSFSYWKDKFVIRDRNQGELTVSFIQPELLQGGDDNLSRYAPACA